MVQPGRAAQVLGQPVGQMLPLLLNPFWSNLDPKILKWPKDFFIYGTDFLPLAAGATQTNSIQIQSDSHFLILAITRTVTATDNTTQVTFVPQLVRIFDAGSGRELMNHQVHMENLAGTAQLPSYLPYPKIIKAQSTVDVEIQNLDSADARNVRFDFWGFKLFKGRGYATLM